MPTKVLCVDDDASFRRLLELRLRSFLPDLEFTSFESLGKAREFLTANTAGSFDLILMDQHLGDGRGADLIAEGWFQNHAVLSVSSDDNPDVPGEVMKAGASFFLNKSRVSEPLLKPLILGLIDRNRISRELQRVREQALQAETIRTLVSTLRHEINNPLGAVLGAAFLMKNGPGATPEQQHAADLVEQSGKRIKHVLDELCKNVAVEEVSKSDHKVFHVPGDKPWGK